MRTTFNPMLVLVVVTAAACGGDGFPDSPDDHQLGEADPVVGGACFDDRDCLVQCERGDTYPGGFCTLPCREDVHCTLDTVCVDTRDGICLFPCGGDIDCGFLGPGYRCRERDDFFGRTVFVCQGG